MRKIVFGVLGVGLVFLAGCSTTKGASGSVDSRVQALENRVQVLEADVQSSGAGSSGEFTSGKSGSVSADSMTKKQIQEALKNAGYYDGTVDGKIGPKTKSALREFQQANNLKVDGIAGRNTREKLSKYIQ